MSWQDAPLVKPAESNSSQRRPPTPSASPRQAAAQQGSAANEAWRAAPVIEKPASAAAPSAPWQAAPIATPRIPEKGAQPPAAPPSVAFKPPDEDAENRRRAKEQFQAFSKQNPMLGQLAGAPSALAQGLMSVGIPADRAAAWLRAHKNDLGAIGGLIGGRGTQTYDEALAQQQGLNQGEFTANPLTGTGLSLASGVGAGTIMNALVPGSGWRQGLASGALMGAGGGAATTPDLTKTGEAARNALTGAALGGALGGALGHIAQPRSIAQEAAGLKPNPETAFDKAIEQEAKQELPPALQELSSVFAANRTQAGKSAALRAREGLGAGREFTTKVERAMAPYMDLGRDLERSGRAPDFFDYVEGATKQLPTDMKPFQKMADDIKAIDKWRTDFLKTLPPDAQVAMRDDYIRHVVKNPTAAVQQWNAFTRAGGAGFTKQREFPTIRDLKNAGIEVASENPATITIHDAMNKAAWVERRRMWDWMKQSGYLRFPEKGGAAQHERVINLPFETSMARTAVAPKSVADIYNNLYSPGLGGSAAFRDIRSFNNLLKQTKLSLSGFHLGTVAGESAASEWGQALTELLNKRPGSALRSLGRGVIRPVQAALPKGAGGSIDKMYEALLNDKGDPAMRHIAELGRKVNFSYRPSAAQMVQSEGSITGRLKAGEGFSSRLRTGGVLGKGGLVREGAKDIAEAGRDVGAQWKRDWVTQAVKTGIGAAIGGVAGDETTGSPWTGALAGAALGGGGTHVLSRALEATMAPVFEHYVPRVKTSLFFDRMQSFIKMNPTATPAEQQVFAARLSDSLDNRLGELARDHLFWKNTVNDSLQVAFLSPSWQIGTIREIGGAVPESMRRIAFGPERLASGAAVKGGQLKSEYIAGLLMSGLAGGGLYEYLKTGTISPEGPSVAPKTGGVVRSMNQKYTPDLPERAQLPTAGYWKDLLALRHTAQTVKDMGLEGLDAAYGEVSNKFAPLASFAKNMTTNRGFDWRGVYGPLADFQKPGSSVGAASSALAEQLEPIASGLARNVYPGSNISAAERWLGIRPASRALQDPIGEKGVREYVAKQALQQKRISEQTLRAKRGEISPSELSGAKKRIRSEGRKADKEKLIRERQERSFGGPQ